MQVSYMPFDKLWFVLGGSFVLLPSIPNGRAVFPAIKQHMRLWKLTIPLLLFLYVLSMQSKRDVWLVSVAESAQTNQGSGGNMQNVLAF